MRALTSPAILRSTLTAALFVSACGPRLEVDLVVTPDVATLEPKAQGKFAIDPSAPFVLSLHGSAVGDPFALTCKDDELVVGLWGLEGTVVNALGLICAKMKGNGTLGASEERPAIGGTTGTLFYSECPKNQAVIELRGRAGTGLDRIGVRCARVRRWVEGGIPGTIAPSFGGGGGAPFTDGCPAGYFLQGALGYATTTEVSAVQGLCVPITS